MMIDKLQEELELLKKISSIEDYQKVTGEEISYSDFVRLDYILDTLEFGYVKIYMHNKHNHKFVDKEKVLNQIEEEYDILNSEDDGYIHYDDIYEQLLKEYISKIKTKDIRQEMMCKAKITD